MAFVGSSRFFANCFCALSNNLGVAGRGGSAIAERSRTVRLLTGGERGGTWTATVNVFAPPTPMSQDAEDFTSRMKALAASSPRSSVPKRKKPPPKRKDSSGPDAAQVQAVLQVMERRHETTMATLRATVGALAVAAGDEAELPRRAPAPTSGPGYMRSDPNRELREELASLQVRCLAYLYLRR